MDDFVLNCIKKSTNGVILTVKLTPNASKDQIVGFCDDYLKIRVSAPPNENKANKKLLTYISLWLNIPKSNVSLLSGDKSRLKKVFIKNFLFEDLVQKISIYDKIST